MSRRTRARTAVCLALMLYCAGTLSFALEPWDTITWSEIVAAVLCVVAMIGLVGHMVDGLTIPGEQYAYLVTGWAGYTTLLLFLASAWAGEADSERLIANTLFLLTGVFGGYGAYLSQRILDEPLVE